MSTEYQQYMTNFNIDDAVKKLEEMFKAAIQDEKLRQLEKSESG